MAGLRGVTEDTATLSAIFPKQELCKLFGEYVYFKEYRLEDISGIKKMKPHVLFGLAVQIWNRIIQYNLLSIDPSAISAPVERRDPETYLKVSKLLGAPVIRDLYYVEGAVAGLRPGDARVAELFAALIYPNNLYLSEIDFSRSDRKYLAKNDTDPIGDHISLFRRSIDNAVSYGKRKECNYLMVVARSQHHKAVLEREGFLTEDPITERQSLNMGLGIPMVRQL